MALNGGSAEGAMQGQNGECIPSNGPVSGALPPPGEYVLVRGVLPAGLSIVGGQLVGTPAAGSVGSYSFVICGADGCRQYFLTVNNSLPVDKYTFGQVMSVLRRLNQRTARARRYAWPTTGTRYARFAVATDIKYIGLRPSDSPAWEPMANSLVLWGYNYNPAGAAPATGAVARPLRAEDMGYADLAATDWVISGSGVPASSSLDARKTLQTTVAVNHKFHGSAASGVGAIAAGAKHAIAMKGDGEVVLWGDNQYGQASNRLGSKVVKQVVGGAQYTLALHVDGTVSGWGQGAAATPPSGLSGVTALAAGAAHAVALKSNGTVVAWGDNSYGQTTVPSGLTGVVAIAAGGRHSLAVKTLGEITAIVAWGSNADGQAG